MNDPEKMTAEELRDELQRVLTLYANAEAQRLELSQRVEYLETAVLAATGA